MILIIQLVCSSRPHRVLYHNHVLSPATRLGRVCRRLVTTGASIEGGAMGRGQRVVAYWLLGCCGMTAGAVVLGQLLVSVILSCGF